VQKAYGVAGPFGHTKRSVFVIDGEGMIRWSYTSPIYLNPGADGILEAL